MTLRSERLIPVAFPCVNAQRSRKSGGLPCCCTAHTGRFTFDVDVHRTGVGHSDMKWVATAIVILLSGCASTSSQWDWVTLMEASHHDNTYQQLANSFVQAGLTPCWRCGYSPHTGTIDVTRKEFIRGRDLLIQKITSDGLTALIRKEWEQPIYMSYVKGLLVEERTFDCFKTSGVQGRFDEHSHPDAAWQEQVRKSITEPEGAGRSHHTDQ